MPEQPDQPFLWQRCERTFAVWLARQGYSMIPLAEVTGNTPGIEAPMMVIRNRKVRCPDILTRKSGQTEYWEVKYRSRPHLDPLIGRPEHRVELAKFSDYRDLWRTDGVKVWLVVYEEASATTAARWLRISVEDACRVGRQALCSGSSDEEEETWLWPVDAMEAIVAPLIDSRGAEPPIVSDDETEPPSPASRYQHAERTVRAEVPEARMEPSARAAAIAMAGDGAERRTIEMDRWAGLDVLRRSLGIGVLPRYSVLRIGTEGIRIDDLMGLLEYGIRVFLIMESDLSAAIRERVQPFIDARLLELERVASARGFGEWIVDGQLATASERARELLEKADESGGINARQYKVVHADPTSDVLVTAGAGTGKTETMSERLVFLLATVHGRTDVTSTGHEGHSRPAFLRLEQVALVTFTREAAAEMRRRIAQTVMLRQRLCRRCIHPAAVWLMDLGRAQISTIHMFAKQVIQRHGAAIGIGQNFVVSSRTLELRRWIGDALSPRLVRLFDTLEGRRIPPMHEWLEHIESVWEALENNGIRLMSFTADRAPEIDWGVSDPHCDVVREVISQVSKDIAGACVRDQFLRTSQLVPAAVEALDAAADFLKTRDARRDISFLFVDEFQDTDAMQLELMLKVRKALGARLFVVGDAKQGIYRFRGASGDAFEALRARARHDRLPPFAEFGLVRNFRTDGNLLGDMHPHFKAWGEHGLLAYRAADRLMPRKGVETVGTRIESRRVRGHELEARISEAASLVLEWRAQSNTDSIAVLCRRNTQAIKVQREILRQGGKCDLLVGGAFYTSEAVRELRAFLEATLDPSDDAAVLEACETRWASALLTQASAGSDRAGDQSRVNGWLSRLAGLGRDGNLDRSDLRGVRQRLADLRDMLLRMSTLAFIVEAKRLLSPHLCKRDSDQDGTREQYARNLNHLVTIMDLHFADSSATADAVLAWLRLQIATNRNEDEPRDGVSIEGVTQAITVHKAKGLEFDRVVIPFTKTLFEPPKAVKTHVFVSGEGAPSRVRWRWNAGGQTLEIQNASGKDEAWKQDEQETDREETRLLYVAMTRARNRLAIIRANRANPTERTWDGLLARGHPE